MMFSSDDHHNENSDEMAARSYSSQRSDPEEHKKSVLIGVTIYFGKSVESQQGFYRQILIIFYFYLFNTITAFYFYILC